MLELDDVEWNGRDVDELVHAVRATSPMWLRIANFHGRSIALLRRLPPGQLVVWKLEHWGAETPFERVPRSPGVDPVSYVDELLALGHRVVPYTFSDYNRHLLRFDVPSLPDPHVVPVALQEAVPSGARTPVRAQLGIGTDENLLGAGGLLHPAKGLDEIAVSFLRGRLGTDRHLLMTVIPDDDAADTARARWESVAGCADSPKLHVQVGEYGGWEWMCDFYRAVDVVLVNSVSESWGRMVSEPIGLERPVVVRRARCGTNHVAPRLAMVDSFAEMDPGAFVAVTDLAHQRAPKLQEFARRRYGARPVRERFLGLLRAHTPPQLFGEFDRLVGNPGAIAALDRALAH